MIGVGEEFPHTTLNGVVGINPDKVIAKVYTDDVQGDWKVIFFYPKDFTFICPTEIVAFEKVAEQENWSVVASAEKKNPKTRLHSSVFPQKDHSLDVGKSNT